MKGRHTLVDPVFTPPTLEKLTELKEAAPNFELVGQSGHAFLDKAIREKRKYRTVRLDMPSEGIIEKTSDFGGLCRKMHKVLSPNGKVIILTDFVPNQEMETLIGRAPYVKEMHLAPPNRVRIVTRNGKSVLVPYSEGRYLKKITTTSLTEELTKAGFEVKVSVTSNPKIIEQSAEATQQAKEGRQRFYLIVSAKKK
ncbi:Uncharacterised protein [uncultured archaeon]|nr:Uncharacterised protein [uncultured archaeon]